MAKRAEKEKSGKVLLPESMFRQMADASTLGIAAYQPVFKNNKLVDFKTLYINDVAALTVNRTPDELIGVNILEVLPNAKEKGALKQFIETYTTGQPHQGELYYNKDEVEGWFEIRVAKMDELLIVAYDNITEKKKTQHKAHKRGKQLNAVFESSVMGIITYANIYNKQGAITDFEIVLVNKEAEQLLGKDRNELMGNTMLQVFPGHVPSGLFNAYKQVAQTGEPYHDLFFYPYDGYNHWFKVSCVQAEGGIMITFTDYSREKQHEEEILQSKQELQSIFDTALTGLASVTNIKGDDGRVIDFQITAVNELAAKILNRQKEELIGMRLLQVFPGLVASGIFKKFIKVADTGEPFQENFYYSYDGLGLAVDMNVSKKHHGLVVAFQDVTEQYRQQLELKASEERFRKIFENAGMGMAIVNNNGVPVIANQFFCYLLGYNASELNQMNFAEFTHPDDREKDVQYYEQLLNGEIDSYQIEKRYLHKNGKVIWGLLTGTMVRNEEGKPLYGIGMVQDITRRKEYEIRLENMNEELDQRVKERTEELEIAVNDLESFSYTVSHDLRGPIRAMIGYSKLVMDRHQHQLDDEGKEFFKLVIESAEHMGNLITDLLEFSRVGQSKLKQQTINTNELVSHVVKEYQALILNEPADFKVEETLPPMQGDPVLLRQVLHNLIGNAVKFKKEGEKPLVKIGHLEKKGENRPIFFVSDNGIGFDQKYAERLFEVFNRMHHKEVYEGTGIGLSIVQRIIDKHGGKVWAEGKKGEGATFYFQLGL